MNCAASLDRRGGFALPAAVFALVIVGVMVTGGFFLAQQESRISAASENSSQALYLAEEGISQVRRDWSPPDYNGMDLWASNTVTGTADEGEWSVTVLKTDSTNYFLVSTGTVTEGGILAGATRSIGMMTRVIYPTINPPAALTTQGPTTVSGNAEINGIDTTLDGRSCPATDNKPGILTNDADDVDNRGQGNIDGDPQPIEEDPSIGNQTFTVFGELTYNDLVAMATWHFDPSSSMNSLGPTLAADGSCEYSNPFNWGDPNNPSAACGDYYPIIHFGGGAGSRVTLQSGGVGQGILLVDGSLDLRGNFQFNGIVIVQGSFETQGSGASAPRINGGVLAGNASLESQNYTGGSVVTNSTCAVHEAVTKSATASRPLPITDRSWVDLSGTSY